MLNKKQIEKLKVGDKFWTIMWGGDRPYTAHHVTIDKILSNGIARFSFCGMEFCRDLSGSKCFETEKDALLYIKERYNLEIDGYRKCIDTIDERLANL